MRSALLPFAGFLLVLLDALSLGAQSNITTVSGNFKNQAHRNLIGACSQGSIDCGPATANPGGGFLSGPNSLQRTDAASPGEIRCVQGFGTADGLTPGAIATENVPCLTTSGVLWSGSTDGVIVSLDGRINPSAVLFNNATYPFTGLPRIPDGADTQFGAGARSENRLDIRGTANDNPVPAGASTGLFKYTIQRDFTDSLTTRGSGSLGAYPFCGNAAPNCQTGFKITWSASAPSNCPSTGNGATCPNSTINGNGFESIDVPCPDGIQGPCREHRMRYGFTQKWIGGATGLDGTNQSGFVNAGSGIQESVISFSVYSKTDGNGNLVSNPTGFYFVESACIAGGSTHFSDCAFKSETDIERTAPRFIGFSQSGQFNTAVTFPGGVPTINVTLTQEGTSGCQHDSNGTTCINRANSFLP